MTIYVKYDRYHGSETVMNERIFLFSYVLFYEKHFILK